MSPRFASITEFVSFSIRDPSPSFLLYPLLPDVLQVVDDPSQDLDGLEADRPSYLQVPQLLGVDNVVRLSHRQPPRRPRDHYLWKETLDVELVQDLQHLLAEVLVIVDQLHVGPGGRPDKEVALRPGRHKIKLELHLQ